MALAIGGNKPFGGATTQREPLPWVKLALALAAVLGPWEAETRQAIAQKPGGDTLLITSLHLPEGSRIFRVNGDGSGRTPLTTGQALAADPALSPDGRRIVFVADPEDGTKTVGLYVMNADGFGRRRLAEAARGQLALAPAWSPDGKRIAFCTVRDDHKRLVTEPRLYVVDADGRGLVQLGQQEGLFPAWSPDGQRLLFSRLDAEAWSLWVVDAIGTNAHELVKGGFMGTWSPDGRLLAYVGSTTGARDLFVARADGSNPRRLTGHPGGVFGPRWSGDGRRLFFTRTVRGDGGGMPGRARPTAVHVVTVEGRDLHQVTGGDAPECLGGTLLFAGSFGDGDSSPPPTPKGGPGQAQEGEEAARWVEGIGGSLGRDEDQPGQPVTGVDLAPTGVTDAELKELVGLSALEALSLEGTAVTDAGLPRLPGLKKLRRLNLGATRVTDAGLKELARFPNLQSLVLSRTEVTDQGLKGLAAIPKLSDLDLQDTKVTGAGLKQLTGCKNLTTLNLQATKVTGAGWKELAGLKKLACVHLFPQQITDVTLRILRDVDRLHVLSCAGGKTNDTPKSLDEVFILDLSYTGVSDAGLKELAGLRNLSRLELDGTRISDAGLKELAGHKNLATLSLRGNGTPLKDVTDAGVAGLRKALPNCTIIR